MDKDSVSEKKRRDYLRLSKKEKIIYDSVMQHFPATKHESAMDAAVLGGVRFQFIHK